jgi:hypothetical protein
MKCKAGKEPNQPNQRNWVGGKYLYTGVFQGARLLFFFLIVFLVKNYLRRRRGQGRRGCRGRGRLIQISHYELYNVFFLFFRLFFQYR